MHNTLHVEDSADARQAAELLECGSAVAQAFGNFYAITARGDAASVARVNLMKGRPASQVGSVTLPAGRISEIFDWSALPATITRDQIEAVMDAFFEVGPFGFRGPALADIGSHLSSLDGDLRTTQLIGPGYACPSKEFLDHAAGDGLLYVTSANRSRHLTGADDTPAHWRSAALREEFPELPVLEHSDEDAARERYPRHLPMSTTIIAFHRTEVEDGRISLILERHGSLHVDDVRTILDGLDLGLTVGPRAQTRLSLRSYPDAA
jgi:hypothetical protein